MILSLGRQDKTATGHKVVVPGRLLEVDSGCKIAV